MNRTIVEQVDDEQRSFVVIGGGPAGLAAAQSLRDQGFIGKITLLSKENVLPYDRTKMSKNMAVTSAEVGMCVCVRLLP
jgi:apoptosis-inducing factor 3